MPQGKKATKGSGSKPEVDKNDDVAGELDSVVEASTLAAVQKVFLQRVARLLVNIQNPRYAKKARLQGYTTEEHKLGWQYWSVASGMDRPLNHWFGEQNHAAEEGEGSAERMRVLREIDTFENRWFPRVRGMIRRLVPRARRDAFAAAFFKDLPQQPLGPAVVGSVTGLLNRIADLEKSEEPGAKALFNALPGRGLTATKIEQVRALLKQAEEGGGWALQATTLSAKDLAAAQARQLEAYEDVRDWFNDWAEMLRDVFGVADQVVLGLTTARGKRGSGTEVLEEEDAGEGDADEEEADQEADAGATPAGKGTGKAKPA